MDSLLVDRYVLISLNFWRNLLLEDSSSISCWNSKPCSGWFARRCVLYERAEFELLIFASRGVKNSTEGPSRRGVVEPFGCLHLADCGLRSLLIIIYHETIISKIILWNGLRVKKGAIIILQINCYIFVFLKLKDFCRSMVEDKRYLSWFFWINCFFEVHCKFCSWFFLDKVEEKCSWYVFYRPFLLKFIVKDIWVKFMEMVDD